jgi:nucleotide-binding universal stress UspA family protein
MNEDMVKSMLPFKRILWPSDFSEASYVALDRAAELAAHFSAELFLLHVVHPIAVVPSPAPGKFDVPSYQRAAEIHALKNLEGLISKEIPRGIKVNAKVLVGTAANDIVNTAVDESVDLIVIATHGETGWRRFVFGSVAEKVVRLAECPVLTIQPIETDD